MQIVFVLIAILLASCGPTILVDGKHIENPPQHVYTAVDKYGLNEYQHRTVIKEYVGVDPRRYEWCAAFVNAVLEESNIQGSQSRMARSFLDWGEEVEEPLAGDIVVFPRGTSDWQGHVGFYVGTEIKNNKEYYRILGGNQNNAVSIDLYPAKKALGIRRANKY